MVEGEDFFYDCKYSKTPNEDGTYNMVQVAYSYNPPKRKKVKRRSWDIPCSRPKMTTEELNAIFEMKEISKAATNAETRKKYRVNEKCYDPKQPTLILR